MIAVYTAVFGGYDTLREVPEPWGRDTDYIVFSDREFDAPQPWQVRVVKPPDLDPRKAARYFLLQSCTALPEYEYTVMHGGNAYLKVDPSSFLSMLVYNDIAAFLHPHRHSVYQEVNACVALDKDKLENMQPQMDRYKEEGFPGEPFHACILLARKNTPELQEFETMWWNEVVGGSHRDQLSFDYCLWKLGMEVTDIKGDPFSSPYLRLWQHDR